MINEILKPGSQFLCQILTHVFSKAISNKLKAVFPTLISLQQTAYVKTRFTGESCRLISDIIEIRDF